LVQGILLDGDKLWVGFSRIRGTAIRENIAGILNKSKGKKALGTRIDGYDLKTMERFARIDTEKEGFNAVFGIYPATDQPATT